MFHLLLAFTQWCSHPAGYWDKPVGLLMAMLLVGGTVAAVLSPPGASDVEDRSMAACSH